MRIAGSGCGRKVSSQMDEQQPEIVEIDLRAGNAANRTTPEAAMAMFAGIAGAGLSSMLSMGIVPPMIRVRADRESPVDRTPKVPCPECGSPMVRGQGFCSGDCCRAYRAAGKAKKEKGF